MEEREWLFAIEVGLIPIMADYGASTKEINTKLDALLTNVCHKYDREEGEVLTEIKRLAEVSINVNLDGVEAAKQLQPKIHNYSYFIEYAKEELNREKPVLKIICEWATNKAENKHKNYNKNGRKKDVLPLCPYVNIEHLKKSINNTINSFKDKCNNEGNFLAMLLSACSQLGFIYSDASPRSFLRDLNIERCFGSSATQNASKFIKKEKKCINYEGDDLDLQEDIKEYLKREMNIYKR